MRCTTHCCCCCIWRISVRFQVYNDLKLTSHLIAVASYRNTNRNIIYAFVYIPHRRFHLIYLRKKNHKIFSYWFAFLRLALSAECLLADAVALVSGFERAHIHPHQTQCESSVIRRKAQSMSFINKKKTHFWRLKAMKSVFSLCLYSLPHKRLTCCDQRCCFCVRFAIDNNRKAVPMSLKTLKTIFLIRLKWYEPYAHHETVSFATIPFCFYW